MTRMTPMSVGIRGRRVRARARASVLGDARPAPAVQERTQDEPQLVPRVALGDVEVARVSAEEKYLAYPLLTNALPAPRIYRRTRPARRAPEIWGSGG